MSDRGFLADADVLIDYSEANLAILTLVTEHIGQIYVLQQVLDTVPVYLASITLSGHLASSEKDTSLIVVASNEMTLLLSHYTPQHGG